MYNYSYEIVENTAITVREGRGMSPQEAFQTSVFCHGAVDMTYDWLENKHNISSGEAASLLIPMLPPNLAILTPRVMPDE